VAPAKRENMLPHPRLDGSDEYDAMTTIAKNPSIAPPPRRARHLQASLVVSSSRKSVRPIVFDAQSQGEDVTRLMPSPHASAFPAPPRVPNDIVPTMRPLKNRVHLPHGQGNTDRPAERSSMRPTAPPPPPSRPQTPPSMRPPSSRRPGQEPMHSLGTQEATRTVLRPLSIPPAPPSSPMSPDDTFRPVAVANARNQMQITGSRGSDSRFEAPPMAHSTNEIVLKGRPTASWAMALVAMGVFAGILTAVVTGGGASSIAQAGAAFVDPSRAAIAQEMPKMVAAAAPIRVEAPVVAAVVAPVVAPAPSPYYAPAPLETATPKPEPVVAVKPAAVEARVVVRAPSPARTAAPTAAASTPASAPAPVAQAVAVAKPAVAKTPKSVKGEAAAADLESANQADKLARQQLEQSL
jgi:hypothetical protein